MKVKGDPSCYPPDNAPGESGACACLCRQTLRCRETPTSKSLFSASGSPYGLPTPAIDRTWWRAYAEHLCGPASLDTDGYISLFLRPKQHPDIRIRISVLRIQPLLVVGTRLGRHPAVLSPFHRPRYRVVGRCVIDEVIT